MALQLKMWSSYRSWLSGCYYIQWTPFRHQNPWRNHWLTLHWNLSFHETIYWGQPYKENATLNITVLYSQ